MPVVIAPAGWLTDVDLGDPDLRLASAQIDRITDLVSRRPAIDRDLAGGEQDQSARTDAGLVNHADRA
jgi:hypothetical protein